MQSMKNILRNLAIAGLVFATISISAQPVLAAVPSQCTVVSDGYISGPDGPIPYCNNPGAQWQGASLSGADLRFAKLSGANLAGADLSSADLSYATLTNADLSGANLTGKNCPRASVAEFAWMWMVDGKRPKLTGQHFKIEC